MTAQRISKMDPARTPLDGTEIFETVQNGRTFKVTLENIRVFTGGGKSAYDVAVQQGFVGNVDDWLLSLRGPKGPKGDAGPEGPQGPQGLSAYEVAVEQGFNGTEQEWLESLVGGGVDAGADGKSAYQLAVEEGYTGTLQEWLDSLQGPQGATGPAGPKGADGAQGPAGADGKSAYQIAVEQGGYTGTEEEFATLLASIQSGGGGGEPAPSAMKFEITDFMGEEWNIPAGTTVGKEYSDTSIKITHNKNAFPTGWFGFNRESTPWTAMVPTAMLNMQIVDANTVIITSVGSLNVFDIALHF